MASPGRTAHLAEPAFATTEITTDQPDEPPAAATEDIEVAEARRLAEAVVDEAVVDEAVAEAAVAEAADAPAIASAGRLSDRSRGNGQRSRRDGRGSPSRSSRCGHARCL